MILSPVMGSRVPLPLPLLRQRLGGQSHRHRCPLTNPRLSPRQNSCVHPPQRACHRQSQRPRQSPAQQPLRHRRWQRRNAGLARIVSRLPTRCCACHALKAPFRTASVAVENAPKVGGHRPLRPAVRVVRLQVLRMVLLHELRAAMRCFARPYSTHILATRQRRRRPWQRPVVGLVSSRRTSSTDLQRR